MQTVTIPQIVERLQQLSDELLVVYDFVSYLADREAERSDHASQTSNGSNNTTGGLRGF